MRLLQQKAWLLYCILIAMAAIVFVAKSNANWDLVAYTACIQQWEKPQASVADIQAGSYEAVRKETTAEAYQLLTSANNPYRLKALTDAGFFGEQLIFYKVKPGYNLLNFIFKKLTGSYRKGIALSSVLGWVMIAILLPVWLKKYLSPIWLYVTCLLLMFLPFMITGARMAAPDMLSAAILLWSFYFIYSEKLLAAMVLMLLALFIRPDNNIYAGFMLLFIWLEHKEKRIRLQAVVCLLAVIAITLYIMWLGGGKGTLTSLYHTGYITRLLEGLRTIDESYLPLVFATVGILFATSIFTTHTKPGKFSVLVVLITASKFLLIPSLENRFFIPLILMTFILSVIATSKKAITASAG